MAVQQAVYSVDDLWELSHQPAYSEKRLELSEGELIIMSPAGGQHGWITMLFGGKILNFVMAHQLGYVTAAETGFILHKNRDGKDTVRAPDVGFISKQRLPDGLSNQFVPLAPDLAIEIVSPNDQADDMQSKLNDYLKYSVPMVVFCYPKTKTINVHSKSAMKVLRVDDVFDGGDVLPGFTMPVREIFDEAAG
jgi:Uma2 family endonuclease